MLPTTLKSRVGDAAIELVPSADGAGVDDAGSGGLAGRAARQGLCKIALRALPRDRADRREPTFPGATIPDAASALSDRNPRRGPCRGHQHGPSGHAGIPARSGRDPRPAILSEDAGIAVHDSDCTVQPTISLAIRPKASLNASTAAGGSMRSSFRLSSNKREATTLPFLSTSRAERPISTIGSESVVIRNRLT